MTNTQINARLDAIKTIEESIASSEQFINKCKAVTIQDDRYLAVFPETMMGVGYGVNGLGFTDTPYSLTQAENYERNVTNGHGQHPVVMSHKEYVLSCIAMQVRHIDTMRDMLEFQAI
jgi:hypothetical protein